MINTLAKLSKMRCSLDRYHLVLPSKYRSARDPKAYLNHWMFWGNLNKVLLHCSSKRILATPELYGSLNLAFSCIARTPRALKSKRSISAFKVMSGTLTGAKSSLRNRYRDTFCYKWAFLAAGEELESGTETTRAVGLKDVFIFELDELNYKIFEPLPGMHIQFDHSL